MITSFLSLSRVLAIAHRGGSKLRPENTMVAFDHGLALGADGLECDVHLSRDGDVVVIHDPTLDRTTNASGPVSALSADELARVDAGYHFGSDDGFPFRGQGIGVPRLRELLDRYAHVPITVEMKGDQTAVAARTIDVVRAARAEGRVVLAGFNQGVLSATRRLAPEMITSAAFDEAATIVCELLEGRFGATRPDFQLFQVPFRYRGQQQFTEPFVRAARNAGLPVQVWIVDDPDEMDLLLGWGVSGLISDRPDLAVQAVVRAKGRGQRAEES